MDDERQAAMCIVWRSRTHECPCKLGNGMRMAIQQSRRDRQGRGNEQDGTVWWWCVSPHCKRAMPRFQIHPRPSELQGTVMMSR